MSELGQSRQFGNVRATSAFALKADIHIKLRHVSKVPSFGLMHRTKTGQCSITASARVRVGSFGQPRLPKTLSHQLRV